MSRHPKICDRCGEAHERCKAHNRAGRPCGRWPVPGHDVCVLHGGKSPGARENAQRRQAEARAEQELRKLWVGLEDATPVDDPVQALSRLAGALQQALDTVGGRVNDLGDHLAAGSDLVQLRAEVVLLERLAARLDSALSSLARLGIENRRIELEAGQAGIVVAAFRAVVEVLQLVPADKDLAIGTFLNELGVGDGVVVGEVLGS